MAKKKKNYEIKSENGTVIYAMRAGSVYVKSSMTLAMANRLRTISDDVRVSDKRGRGLELCVDDTYFFPCVETDTDEVTENE